MKIYVDKETKQIKAFERYGNLIFEGESIDLSRYDVFDIAENTKDYLIWFKYVDGELIENKPEIPVTNLETEIKNTINAMVLNVIPDGETLTKDNAPSLVDIINPATNEESGTKTNPIVIIDNDIAHNGYLYTYGKYYKWRNVVYQCKRTGESDGGTIKLYYTPDQLIGHYFVTV